MQIFTGIDIVENCRIEKTVNKLGSRFLNRIYTKKELEYCCKKKEYIQCLASRFACKEAVIKAFFQAFNQKLFFKQIEILGKHGLPAEILLHLEKLPPKEFQISISISHENTYSVASVIIVVY